MCLFKPAVAQPLQVAQARSPAAVYFFTIHDFFGLCEDGIWNQWNSEPTLRGSSMAALPSNLQVAAAHVSKLCKGTDTHGS